MALRFKPGGLEQLFEPGLPIVEAHTSTCAHCQKITPFPSLRRMMDHVEICRGCMRLICLECYGKPCRPWEKECERQELEGKIRCKLHDNWRCF